MSELIKSDFDLARRIELDLEGHLGAARALARLLSPTDNDPFVVLASAITRVIAQGLDSDLVRMQAFNSDYAQAQAVAVDITRARALASDLAVAVVVALDVAHARVRDLDSALAIARAGARALAGHAIDCAEQGSPVTRSLNNRKHGQDSSDERAIEEWNRKLKPPACAERILGWLAPLDWREGAIGDFWEIYERDFHRVCAKHGLCWAKIDYCGRVLRSAPGLLRIRCRRLAVVAGVLRYFASLRSTRPLN